MNKLPISFDSAANLDKMKDFVKKFAQQSEKEVKSISNLMGWLEKFDLKSAP